MFLCSLSPSFSRRLDHPSPAISFSSFGSPTPIRLFASFCVFPLHSIPIYLVESCSSAYLSHRNPREEDLFHVSPTQIQILSPAFLEQIFKYGMLAYIYGIFLSCFVTCRQSYYG